MKKIFLLVAACVCIVGCDYTIEDVDNAYNNYLEMSAMCNSVGGDYCEAADAAYEAYNRILSDYERQLLAKEASNE